MIISHKNKFIFYKPMKVAGSSVEASLISHCDDSDIITGSDLLDEREKFGYIERNVKNSDGSYKFHAHTSPVGLFNITNSPWLDYYKFTIVRNPWDLMVSYFWWNSFAKSSSGNCNIYPSSLDTIDDLRSKFSTFIETVGIFNSGPRGCEGASRVIDWVSSITKEFYRDVDHVMRYESLQSDYENVCSRLEIKSEMLHHLKSFQRKSDHHYTEYYGTLEKIQVKLAFQDIINIFSYEFK